MEEKPTTRRSMFAVWRWHVPWWAWCLVAALTPAVYVLLAIPIMTLALVLDWWMGQSRIFSATREFFALAMWLGEKSEFIGLVLAWEQHVMLTLFHVSA